MYISVKQAAAKWEISDRRVRVLCENGQVEGAMKVGKTWNIPESAKKPRDPRKKINYIADKEKRVRWQKTTNPG